MVMLWSGGLGHSNAKPARRAIQIDSAETRLWREPNVRTAGENIAVRDIKKRHTFGAHEKLTASAHEKLTGPRTA